MNDPVGKGLVGILHGIVRGTSVGGVVEPAKKIACFKSVGSACGTLVVFVT